MKFPTSCAASVQEQFERGIALLHSFGYITAKTVFREIEDRDPGCAMAYWGDAMTRYHQLWYRPSANDLQEGLLLVQKAQKIGGVTERERGFIKAAAALYVSGDTTYETRAGAYSAALKALHEKFPDDDEATVFYALSLISSPDADKNDFAYRKTAVSILNEVLSRRPDHPGVAHYLIHACDNPQMAKDGLAAARRYAQIAPDSPHAVHMPSHIFARLGLWQDDVQSNLASKAIAEKQKAEQERMHAMQYLEYAYLQLGEFEKAKAVETEALQIKPGDFSKGKEDFFFFVQVRFPTLYLLETKAWKDVYSLKVSDGTPPDFEAVVYWAQALAAGHLRDATRAKDAVAKYDAAFEAVQKSSYSYVAEQMTPQRDEAHAWSEFAQGNTDGAIHLLTAVADNEDKVGKQEVEIPAREMLADMLMELDRPQEAFKQYSLSLKVDPNRFNSLSGAARAAKLADKR